MAMGRPRAFDKEAALTSAMEVFWRRGYEGASLAELTKAMGINPPSLYAAFGNKEGLLKAALDHYGAKRADFLRSVLDAPTAHEVAARMLYGTADMQTDPANPPGCLLVQGGLACGSGAEAIPSELAGRRATNEDLFRTRFERSRAKGDLPADAEPAALARYLSAVIGGMGVQAAAGATREDLREIADVALRAFPSGRPGAQVVPAARERAETG
jgi:AcrR family transcriptional regulator